MRTAGHSGCGAHQGPDGARPPANTRSPSQCPGTARSATSAGRWLICRVSRSWPRPGAAAWLADRASPGPSADSVAAPGVARRGSGGTATGRWSRATPASPGRKGRPGAASRRSAAVTTAPPAWPPPPPAAAAGSPPWPPWAAGHGGTRRRRRPGPDSGGGRRYGPAPARSLMALVRAGPRSARQRARGWHSGPGAPLAVAPARLALEPLRQRPRQAGAAARTAERPTRVLGTIRPDPGSR